MPKSINNVCLEIPQTLNEKIWFSTIKQIIERTGYGTIELKITVKEGKVMTVKERTEKSYSLSND